MGSKGEQRQRAHRRITERLKLSVERLQALHDHLLALLQTINVSKSLDQENLTILERPLEAQDAKKSILVTALLLGVGLGAGLGLVAFVERRDDRIMSMEDLAGHFSEWIVGGIPDLPRPRKPDRLALLTINDARHAFAQSHRNIRSALRFGVDEALRPKAILIASAIPGEGKSTLAANLARAMTFAGARVLLINADLRHGILHELYEQPAEPGLAEVLSAEGAPSLSACCLPTSVPSLTLLPRGRPRDDASELLLSATCDRFLARVRTEFDCVILDSVAVFAADDTPSLAPKVDGVLFVVRGSYTGASTARNALNLLYERQARVTGLVFNRSDSDLRSCAYYARGDGHRFGPECRNSGRGA